MTTPPWCREKVMVYHIIILSPAQLFCLHQLHLNQPKQLEHLLHLLLKAQSSFCIYHYDVEYLGVWSIAFTAFDVCLCLHVLQTCKTKTIFTH